MQSKRIIYYVAVSLDGYISGQDGDISQFAQGGAGVEQYLKDLEAFDTVIMGRNTYEFGYQFGLQAGQPAYAHMDHYIFSNNLAFENSHEQVKVLSPDLAAIDQILAQSKTDVYLCGGGFFAGWLLDHGKN